MKLDPEQFKKAEPYPRVRDSSALWQIIGKEYENDPNNHGIPVLKRLLDLHREGAINTPELFSVVSKSDLKVAVHGFADISKENIISRAMDTGRGPAVQGLLATTREQAQRYLETNQPYLYVTDKILKHDLPLLQNAKGIVFLDEENEIDGHSLTFIEGQTYIVARAASCNFPPDGTLCSLYSVPARLAKGPVMLKNGGDLNAPELQELLAIAKSEAAKSYKTIRIGAIVNSLKEVQHAIQTGADHIGPVRTEYFLPPKAKDTLLDLITDAPHRDYDQGLAELEVAMKEQYVALLEHAKKAGVSVEIRMLDAPLFKLLGCDKDDISTMKKQIPHFSRARATFPDEKNAKLSKEDDRNIKTCCYWRGVRLVDDKPELYQLQMRAIQSACEQVPGVTLQVTLPFITLGYEIDDFQEKVLSKLGISLAQDSPFSFRTMMETPASIFDRNHKKIQDVTLGMRDFEETLTAGLRKGYFEQTVAALNGQTHPAITEAMIHGLAPYEPKNRALVWHKDVVETTGRTMQKNYGIGTLVVSPSQLMFALIFDIKHGVKKMRKQAEISKDTSAERGF